MRSDSRAFSVPQDGLYGLAEEAFWRFDMVFVMVADGLFGSAGRHVLAFRTCSAVAPELFSGVSLTSLWGYGAVSGGFP